MRRQNFQISVIGFRTKADRCAGRRECGLPADGSARLSEYSARIFTRHARQHVRQVLLPFALLELGHTYYLGIPYCRR
jgi:hypothetical protein